MDTSHMNRIRMAQLPSSVPVIARWLARPAIAASPLRRLQLDLRSNHAGEFGAVCIYQGARWAILRRCAGESSALAFVAAHEAAERRHLTIIEQLVPFEDRTRLLPVWHAAGFLLGALPVLLGGPTAL